MSDSAPGGRSGHFEETPEARPLEPPQWRDHFEEPIAQPGQAAGQQAQASQPPPSAGQAPRVEPVVDSTQLTPEALARSAREFADMSPEERAAQLRQVGDKLKPLAADAEKLAVGALGAAAKGLSGLAAKLEERRKQREG